MLELLEIKHPQKTKRTSWANTKTVTLKRNKKRQFHHNIGGHLKRHKRGIFSFLKTRKKWDLFSAFLFLEKQNTRKCQNIMEINMIIIIFVPNDISHLTWKGEEPILWKEWELYFLFKIISYQKRAYFNKSPKEERLSFFFVFILLYFFNLFWNTRPTFDFCGDSTNLGRFCEDVWFHTVEPTY